MLPSMNTEHLNPGLNLPVVPPPTGAIAEGTKGRIPLQNPAGTQDKRDDLVDISSEGRSGKSGARAGGEVGTDGNTGGSTTGGTTGGRGGVLLSLAQSGGSLSDGDAGESGDEAGEDQLSLQSYYDGGLNGTGEMGANLGNIFLYDSSGMPRAPKDPTGQYVNYYM